MDEYGHSAAAKAGILMFEMGCRQTGRTMRLIERVTNDDQIVAPTSQVAEHLRRELKRAGKATQVLVIEPGTPMYRAGSAPRGRTWFEHTWTQAFFEIALESAKRDLEHFQRSMSKTWPEAPELDASAEPLVGALRMWKD